MSDTVNRYDLEYVKDDISALRREMHSNWQEYYDWKRAHVHEYYDSLHELQDRVHELETAVARLLEAAHARDEDAQS